MKKVIFLFLVLNSFLFGVNYTVPIVGNFYDHGTYTSSSCSPDQTNYYETSNKTNLYGTAECFERPNSTFQYMQYNVFRDYECGTPVNGVYTISKSDTTKDGTCTYSCNISSCPSGQIFNSSSCTCECPPPVDGYDTIAHGVSTEAQCNVVDASLLSLTDGEIQYITDVRWDSCRNQCLAKMAPCPCKTAIFNGACVEVIPPEGACPPGATAISKSTIGEAGPICGVWFKNPDTGFECYQAQTGCCLGDDGGDDGGGDSNSTNPDTNTTNPGDPGEDGGEDGEEDGGETGGGDSNTSTPAPGDSNTSTPAPGDSNTSTPGDSNTSTPYEEYEESDADKDGKESISGYLDEAVNTANKIKSDYERLMSAIQNGVAPVSISSGSAPQFCATVFGKQICINLCDSFGYFYSIFYYIFLILLTVMALRIYYTAFKMR